MARFFLLQYWCGAIALAHLLAEWLYFGRPARRLNLALLTGLLAAGAWPADCGHSRKCACCTESSTLAKRRNMQTQAAQSFARWHAASETVNLLVIGGLILYLWHVSRPPESPRFGSFSKIRG